MLSRRGSGCPITIVRMAALGATSPFNRAPTKAGSPHPFRTFITFIPALQATLWQAASGVVGPTGQRAASCAKAV